MKRSKLLQRCIKRNCRIHEEPLVSIDFNTNTHSAIIDGLSTMVMGDRKVKVLAWYDNEWGYSRRVVDLVTLVVDELAKQKNVQHI